MQGGVGLVLWDRPTGRSLESTRFHRPNNPIVLIDLNVDPDEAQNPRSQIIANLLTEFGLIDLMYHFWQSLRCPHLKMWTQIRQGAVLRSRCDYIIGTDRRIFELLVI